MKVKFKHRESFKSFKSMLNEKVRTSNRNIQVYKILMEISIGGRPGLCTPFEFYPIDLTGGLIIAENFSGFLCGFLCGALKGLPVHGHIESGVHAYTKPDVAVQRMREINVSRPSTYLHVISCIVPAHTPYIVGMNNEIASLVLMVPPITKITDRELLTDEVIMNTKRVVLIV